MTADAEQERALGHTDRLAAGDFRALERTVAQKRSTWLEEHGYPKQEEWSPGRAPVTPRRACETFFFDYLGIDPEQLLVVEESDSRITWLSQNPCKTLDACRELGLDTRTVCRAVYEKPTQLFMTRLDPALRFVRDYTEIRPHAAVCWESIVRVDPEQSMREALAEARTPKAEGNIKAICQATAALGSADLCGALVVSTCEPCPMCAGLAVWANVSTVIFGSSIADTAAMGRTRIMVGMEEMRHGRPSPWT